MKNILFITHEATRTGAPFVILYFMQWLRKHQPDVKIDVLALKGGDLKCDFVEIADSFYEIPAATVYTPKSRMQRIVQKVTGVKNQKSETSLFWEKLTASAYSVIYANTVLTIPTAVRVKGSSTCTKLCVNIHELTSIIELKLPEIRDYTKSIDLYVCGSHLVKNNLVENYEVPVTKTTVVYEYSNATIPELSNIDLNSFIVGGAGTAHWRKGSDLFVQLALYINKNYPEHPIKFNWMGYVNSTEKIILNEDIRKSNLQDVITFTPASPDYLDVFKTFSLLAMTSREDPFPLVCIEIGMMGKPIVCFKGATGSEEIIEKGGGVIVPYLDVPAMAEAIIIYYENRDTLETDGAINKLEFSKFTPEIICPQLWDVISKEL